LNLYDGHILFAIIAILMATMDYYDFHKPHDKGYWSLKTGSNKFDVWHSCKRVILFIIAYKFIGIEQLIQILSNSYFQYIVIAYLGQYIFFTKRR